MLSIDTNLLLHAFNADSPSHAAAYAWLTSLQDDHEVAISEFVLAELYGLLREWRPSVASARNLPDGALPAAVDGRL